MTSKEYEQSEENKVRIHKHRAHYDYETIHSVIKDSQVVHVAFCRPITGQIENLPMIGVMGNYGNKGEHDIYLHGNIASMLYKGSKVEPLQVCVTATQVDGIVLLFTPDGHSLNYRSAVIHGTAEAVTDSDETAYAMKRVMDHMVPNRWENINPITEQALNSVKVVRVSISSASAKVRTGFGTAERIGSRPDVWSGVIPLYRKMGTPVESSYNSEFGRSVQQHISDMINEKNRRWEKYSIEASSD